MIFDFYTVCFQFSIQQHDVHQLPLSHLNIMIGCKNYITSAGMIASNMDCNQSSPNTSLIRRLSYYLIREIITAITSIAITHIWCAAIFWYLGYSLSESSFLILITIPIYLFTLLERGFTAIFPRHRPAQFITTVTFAFLAWSGTAATWLTLINETVLFHGNLADTIFTGLAIGIPSGAILYSTGKITRHMLDCLSH